MLAAQTENCCPGDIGMIDVSRDQTAEIVRVFSGAAATAFMQQESDAVHILEELMGSLIFMSSSECLTADLIGSAFAIKLCQLCHLLTIKLWRGETQLLFERLLQVENVAVFAKDQRHDEPIISGADLSI